MVMTRGGAQILTELIPTGAIGAVDIATDAIHTSKIAAGRVQACHIAADAVGTAKIAANGIEATNIAADAVGTAKIAAGRVQACHLANDAVGTAKIAADGVQASHLHASVLDSHLIFGSAAMFAVSTGAVSYAITGASIRFAWGQMASQLATKYVDRCRIVNDSTMRFICMSWGHRSYVEYATSPSRIVYVALKT